MAGRGPPSAGGKGDDGDEVTESEREGEGWGEEGWRVGSGDEGAAEEEDGEAEGGAERGGVCGC